MLSKLQIAMNTGRLEIFVLHTDNEPDLLVQQALQDAIARFSEMEV